jgi:hypothetical protein
MREIFESYPLVELRKLATSYNKNVKITRVSTLKKAELINELMKHTQHFKDLKPNKMKPKTSKPAEKPAEKPVEKPDYRISVINKKKDQSSFDFNFSRDFKYKTIKTNLGYDFIFKNLKDYQTAKDITLFNMNYKNPRLYEWIYHNDIKKRINKAEPTKTTKSPPAEKTKETVVIKKTDLSDEDELVKEWDTPSMPIFVSQRPKLKISEFFNSNTFKRAKTIVLNELIPLLPYKKLFKEYKPQDILDGLSDLVKYFDDEGNKFIANDDFKKYFKMLQGIPANTLKLKVDKSTLKDLGNIWLNMLK